MVESSNERLRVTIKFYDLLDGLERRVGGARTLKTAHGRMKWPQRGVYFFFEPGEFRSTSGEGLRVVRVGTHALKTGSKSTLWNRLRQHRGTLSGKYAGGGNHRGSVFRLHVGTALIRRNKWDPDVSVYWANGPSASNDIRRIEQPLEETVSDYIRNMSFVWIKVDDIPGQHSMRGYIERNAIALLSSYPFVGSSGEGELCVDPPSKEWLGRYAFSNGVTYSGLWNSNHVDGDCHPEFLNVFKDYILRI